ncbi:hypothetical protein EDF78_1246 [Rahnella sp. BIGb0236]|uniref:SMEK domain-containing protein n=1 Tax=unclassified Rahnella TaxID=2635087 RepID=UPI000C342989|nr:MULTISPECIES: SMEK domain-containing protein [unclassified Rahnella]PKE27444.1 hypothetical protein CWS43_26920 [Rahnella sp. AA]TDS83450.1 hypothetical protein EDF78_1246 [Rahnella sp. BIGb0236]
MEPERLRITQDLISFISVLSNQISLSTRKGLNDLSKIQEQSLLRVINKVFDKKFVDLNDESPNFPGYDYGDDTNLVGLQMTATKKSEKITHTLTKIKKNKNITSKYTSLWFFILSVDSPKRKSIPVDGLSIIHLNLSSIIDAIRKLEIKEQQECLDLIKEEYKKYFQNEKQDHEVDSIFKRKTPVSIPNDMTLFCDSLNISMWYPNDINEGYIKVHGILTRFRDKLRDCRIESREALEGILREIPYPQGLNDKMEVDKDKLYGRLNIRIQNSYIMDGYISDLEINELLDTQEEPAGWYEENGESYLMMLEKIILNYKCFEPEMNLYMALIKFYEKYHSIEEFMLAILNSDFSLLSDGEIMV